MGKIKLKTGNSSANSGFLVGPSRSYQVLLVLLVAPIGATSRNYQHYQYHQCYYQQDLQVLLVSPIGPGPPGQGPMPSDASGACACARILRLRGHRCLGARLFGGTTQQSLLIILHAPAGASYAHAIRGLQAPNSYLSTFLSERKVEPKKLQIGLLSPLRGPRVRIPCIECHTSKLGPQGPNLLVLFRCAAWGCAPDPPNTKGYALWGGVWVKCCLAGGLGGHPQYTVDNTNIAEGNVSLILSLLERMLQPTYQLYYVLTTTSCNLLQLVHQQCLPLLLSNNTLALVTSKILACN